MNELTTIQKQENEYEEKHSINYTDMPDVSFDISLFEYGIIRNPKTKNTIFCLTANYKDSGYKFEEHEFVNYEITLQEVIEDLNDMPEGFFSFIGSNLNMELENLENDNLSNIIQSINQYDGRYTA